jgi:ribosomal protein S12 methylthiotransferase accessory factor
LADYGITRVADVTGLDVLGVPVAVSVRPLARTLSVSQGKGQTLLLAKVSAAMEALEFCHMESHSPPQVHRQLPARELGLPYRIEQLCSDADTLITDAMPLDWLNATGMRSGATVPVPARLVVVTAYRQPWLPHGLGWTTNGLASGNTADEAALHALYELIERDAASGRPCDVPADYVEPGSVADPSCAELIERITAAGATLRIIRVPSRFGVPCFGASVWSPELPLMCLGWGAHLDAGVAVSRAVTEAAQSRAATIAGSRDDIPPLYDIVRTSTDEHPPACGSVLSWDRAARADHDPFDDVSEELAWVCAKTAEITGSEPLCVDLSTAEEFAVVKVLVPGMKYDRQRTHSMR